MGPGVGAAADPVGSGRRIHRPRLTEDLGAFGGSGMGTVVAMVGSLGFRPAILWAWMLALAEFAGGLGVLVGLLTRLAAAAIAVDMAVAIAEVQVSRQEDSLLPKALVPYGALADIAFVNSLRRREDIARSARAELAGRSASLTASKSLLIMTAGTHVLEARHEKTMLCLAVFAALLVLPAQQVLCFDLGNLGDAADRAAAAAKDKPAATDAKTADQPTLSLPPWTGPKKRLGVMDLDVKVATTTAVQPTTSGGAVSTTTVSIPPPSDFGSGLTEMLTTSLFDSKRFILLERKALADIQAEQALGTRGATSADSKAEAGKLLGAQALIRGAVTEFTYNQSSTGGSVTALKGIGIGASKAEAAVVLDIRIYDATTGVILDSIKAEGRAKSSSTSLDINRDDLQMSAGASPRPRSATRPARLSIGPSSASARGWIRFRGRAASLRSMRTTQAACRGSTSMPDRKPASKREMSWKSSLRARHHRSRHEDSYRTNEGCAHRPMQGGNGAKEPIDRLAHGGPRASR